MSRVCTDPACGGTFSDGFCDTCGRAEPAAGAVTPSVWAAAPAPATAPASAKSSTGAAHVARQGGYSRVTGRVTGARRPASAHGATGTTPGTSPATAGSVRTGSARSRGSSSRRRALGGGLVQMPVEPSLDPLKLLMADARVPPGKAVCPSCGQRVNPDKHFCSNCGAEFNFRPSLKAGDLLAEQYEVKGPIAFGGLGWIYLAMDTRLNRWVVLKGLLNSKDPAAAAAAVAERQFLAAVKHAKIVGIYTFVLHAGESFIVMEFVGGRTLKAIRRERGPLPAAEAMAFILGILPAFAYLHEQGLVYCDFKPDNVMLEGDDVKLIDMGAVRRIGDPHGDIYGTVGYKAPEAEDDPQAASDLFTIGRTLATLLMDFDNTGRYVSALPPPGEMLRAVPEEALREAGVDPATDLRATLAAGGPLPAWLRWNAAARTFVGTAPAGVVGLDVRVGAGIGGAALPVALSLPLAANESLYRFLLKATAPNQDGRFQSADEMAAQLTGVLRETVARTGPVPAMDSVVFLPEPAVPGDPLALAGAWRRLPELRLDQTDPAAGEIFAARAAPAEQRAGLLAAAARAKPQSSEARLRSADAMIASGTADVDAVMAQLDAALTLDAFDWRPDWYCGKLYLSLGRAAEAVECFDKVYGEIPGEPAPKLALAMALEAEGRGAEAAGLYDTVSRTDPALAAATFGLARCLTAAGDREGAVEALLRVPDSAALSGEARLAAVRALAQGDPSETHLRHAAEILASLTRDDIARHEAEAELAMQAARQVEAGVIKPNGATLLGAPMTGRGLRLQAEAALRACARLSEGAAARIAFVDRANATRPRTLT
jgi:serine/threonine-protein kinase PknG